MKFYREKVFPALAGTLWIIFLFLDLTRMGDSTGVKFAAICLCLLTALTGLGTADGRLVALALGFTVAADVFLLVLDRSVADQLTGVALFIPVQLLYAFRLYLLRRNKPCKWGLVPRLFGLVLAAVLTAFHAVDPLSALTGFYFLNLCFNCAEAFRLEKPERRFAWGLLLFVCCDLCVGAWNLGLFPGFARVGMWLFYLPSQVLIVLSAHLKGVSHEAIL